jgi:hypothetical protein
MAPLDAAARSDVETALRQAESWLATSRREVVIALLTRLAAGTYPEAIKDAQAFLVRASDMADDLQDMSEQIIAWALISHRRTEKFFPKTSEIREKALEWHCCALVVKHRAMVLLGRKEPFAHERLPAPADDPAELSEARKSELLDRAPAGMRNALKGMMG